jgi:hypothetical protein
MSPNDICIHSGWKDGIGFEHNKVPTVLYYDDEYKNVQSWGYMHPTLGREESERKPIKLFKLLLGKMSNEPPLQYEKAIIDYLLELGKIVKRTIQHVDFYTQALIVLTVNKFNIC